MTSTKNSDNNIPEGTQVGHRDAQAIRKDFDVAFYLSCFPQDEAPADPIQHYLDIGWHEGRDPAPWFSTRFYLAAHADIRAAGMNPFVHYCQWGGKEGRAIPVMVRATDSPYEVHSVATSPGKLFEEFDPTIGLKRKPRAKVLAYFLPQFHPIPENDYFWGKGFTEWRNLPRGEPRFESHIQPKIPRDLGCYDLVESDVYRRQIEMARQAGIHGFCFYHYWFDGKRVLERPMEKILADPSLDFPFVIMWANENWTRTWEGDDREVLLKQSYHRDDEAPFIDDLARHFEDPRYIRIGDRPLFFIYRPGHIPDGPATLERWRQIFRDRHGIDPLIFMAQAFGDNDPRAFGLDGAIEFPPHKVLNKVNDSKHLTKLFDPQFSGSIRMYDDVVDAATADPTPDFPLIRTVLPAWDNDARRPGRSTILANSTPEKFGRWLDWALEFAQTNPIHGEAFVCINAWNEWAEGAYLEPDVHFGAAYLNSVARSVFGVARQASGNHFKILLVGHDALKFGAQLLLLEIGKSLAQRFGCDVAFLLKSEGGAKGVSGPLLPLYAALGPTRCIDPADPELPGYIAKLRAQGFDFALTNTTVAGSFAPHLKDAGFAVVSLIHELRGLIDSYGLAGAAQDITSHADRLIFPSEVVRESFLELTGTAKGVPEIMPQGLYKTSLLSRPAGDGGLRARLGIPDRARLVINMGYSDQRKGIDRFIATAMTICAVRDDVWFVWVGPAAPEASAWHMPDVARAGLSDRIRLTGAWEEDVGLWYAAADVFFLSSREDPFPSVVMEALAMGLPVVGYEGTGGCDRLIQRHGRLVNATDPLAAAGAITALLDAAPEMRRMATARRQAEIAANYRFDNYCFELLRRFKPGLQKVSVVVPNYNYQRYIGARLASVFDQTLPVFETIVLDDASPDASLNEIRKVAEAHQRSIDLVVNEVNSGSPFPQWRKGVTRATGDYVWIAEADDLADPGFLATLAKRMAQTGAAIGFCDSRQIDENGDRLGDSYKPYLNEIEPGRFDTAFDMAGQEFLARFLSVKNVILNVSGVLFHREVLAAAIDAVGPALDLFGVAGDWRLYIEICAMGGRVVYEPAALNSHRRHSISVTHALKVGRHLEEVDAMQRLAMMTVNLDPGTRMAQKQHMDAAKKYLGVA